jgi:hypothetical protein
MQNSLGLGWDQVHGLIELLEPIASFISVCESDHCRLSHLPELFQRLEAHALGKIGQSPLSKREEESARNAVKVN